MHTLIRLLQFVNVSVQYVVDIGPGFIVYIYFLRQCTYDRVLTTVYLRPCTYDRVRTTVNLRPSTYDRVLTTMYLRPCTNDRVLTTVYLRPCTYDRVLTYTLIDRYQRPIHDTYTYLSKCVKRKTIYQIFCFMEEKYENKPVQLENILTATILC